MATHRGSGGRVPVRIGDRTLTLSNLDKELYPGTGFTKARVIDYYTRIAPVLLPHLAGRPLTVKRYPDGVAGQFFFEKNAPSHRPDWVHVERLPSPGSSKQRETIDYTVVDDLPTLVWLANLAALELHTPMWRVGADGPDLVVFDLDPGAPAALPDCCRVALMLRPLLADDGLTGVAKTSGSKGLQLYARAPAGWTSAHASDYARGLAERLENDRPDVVVSRMTRSLRPGKVLVDWSQNNAAKTTVSVYSLRARARPTVSTPLTWDEVAAGAEGDAGPVIEADDVLERVERQGDLFAPLL